MRIRSNITNAKRGADRYFVLPFALVVVALMASGLTFIGGSSSPALAVDAKPLVKPVIPSSKAPISAADPTAPVNAETRAAEKKLKAKIVNKQKALVPPEARPAANKAASSSPKSQAVKKVSAIVKPTAKPAVKKIKPAAKKTLARTPKPKKAQVKKASKTRSKKTAAANDKKFDKFGMPMKALRALEKKHKCKEMVRYREIIPYFGMEKTKEVSKEIAIGVEKKDIASGRAKLVDVKYNCFPILGNFYVNCTTDVTLCYVK